MKEKYAKFLLNKTQQDYNRIAHHFSKTRSYIWKDLEYFLKFVSDKDRVLDLGCGNGRLLEIFKYKSINYIGIDSSKKLIKIARKSWTSHVQSRIQLASDVQSIKFAVANALNLPFGENYFDKIFSIAVLHHIPSKKFRLKFLKEAKRVLKDNGLLILTVWNLWKEKPIKKCLNSGFKQFKRFLRLDGKSKLDFKDIFYPWKNQKGEILAQRYIHCFTIRELKKLAQKAGFRIKEIGFLGEQKRNIYLIAKNV